MPATDPKVLLWSYDKWAGYVDRCSIGSVERKISHYEHIFQNRVYAADPELEEIHKERVAYLKARLPLLKTIELLKGN